MPKPPIALTIAGSDPSGGAGLQADLKTFAAHGVYGASVVTALTAQNTTGVFGIHGVPVEFVTAQADAVLEDLEVDAIKIGMLGDPKVIEAVAEILRSHPDIPVVLDPVMVAASGDPLLPPEAFSALKELLFPLATVATPNLPEAGLLLGRSLGEGLPAMLEAAQELMGLGSEAILLKGGRREVSLDASDVLVTRTGHHSLIQDRIELPRPQGTGCTLSSAIAAGLAQGRTVEDAAADAKAYVTGCLRRAATHPVGRGARPLIHR